MSVAEQIFRSRYAIDDHETWEQLSTRVAGGAAQAEEHSGKWAERFADDIFNVRFLPGGRILRNVGRLRGTLFNCYVEPLDDSISQIGQFQKNCGILWAEGGGVGCNASFLRPEGAPIVQKGGFSSGPIAFLKWANAGADCIRTGGSRRAAALAMMNVSHPDIVKFINAKLVDGDLSCFNISVGVVDEFLDAVEDDSPWELKWNNKVWDTVDARAIWDRIVMNMVNVAEPGIINWDNLRSNNSYYFDPILSTNPCGEVPLGAHGMCCLGSLVLPNFIKGTRNTNWQQMESTIHNAVRLLDNIIQINRYVIEEVKQKAFDGRRIGIGIMGLAEYMFVKGVRYGSSAATRVVNTLMENIRNYAYDASIQLAEEKSSFPKFDAREYSRAHFVRGLPAQLRSSIKRHGIRNVTLLAIAPTGTISLLAGVNSSIEPLPFKAYMRHDDVGDRTYIHSLYEKILSEGGKVPEWYVDSADLHPMDHLETQVAVQKYVDGAVSKTINCPKGFKAAQVSDLLLEYIRDLKGVTLYVDGSRAGQILNPLTEAQAKKFIVSGEASANQEATDCAIGGCDI